MEDLEPVLAKLKDNLIAKNIASEVATSLIESVMMKLEGSVMGTFQSIASSFFHFSYSQGCYNTILDEAAHL
jgi:signal recognition particle receptor subunit alpha